MSDNNTEACPAKLLLCSKCSRKLGSDGKALRKAIEARLRTSRWADVELEKTDCFSLCPKEGQVLATLRKAHRRRLVVIDPDSDIAAALDYLLGAG